LGCAQLSTQPPAPTSQKATSTKYNPAIEKSQFFALPKAETARETAGGDQAPTAVEHVWTTA
jgi:hypothetical protein